MKANPKLIAALAFLFLINSLAAQIPKLVLPMGHTNTITSMAFSPDGKRILTGSQDKTIKIWDVASGRLLADIRDLPTEVTKVTFNKDGTRFLSIGSLDSSVRLWNSANGKMIASISTGKYYVDFASFSPDGKLLVIKTLDNKPRLFSGLTGEAVLNLKNSDENIESAVFSRDGKYILVKHSYSDPVLWDLQTGDRIMKYKVNGSIVSEMDYSADGKYFVGGSVDKKVSIWEAATGKLVITIPASEDAYISSVVISPDSKRFVVTRINSYAANLYDIESGKLIAPLKNSWPVQSVNFSEDGQTVISQQVNGTQFWDAQTGKEKFSGLDVLGAYSPGDREIVMTNSDGVYVANVVTGKNILHLETEEGIKLITFDSKGKILAGVLKSGKEAAIWDLHSGRQLTKLKGFTSSVEQASIFAEPNIIVIDGWDHASLWELENGILIPVSEPVNDSIYSARVSPDGKRMVLESQKKGHDLSLWDTRTLKCVNPNLQKRGMQDISFGKESSFAFSADSKKYFIGNEWWESYVFSSDSGRVVNRLPVKRSLFPRINADMSRYLEYDNNKLTIMDVNKASIVGVWEVPGSPNDVEFIGVPGRFITLDMNETVVFDEDKKSPVKKLSPGLHKFNRERTRIVINEYRRNKIFVWDLDKLTQLTEISSYIVENEYVGEIEWSFDQKHILVPTNNSRVLIIDVETGKVFKELQDYARSIRYSPDGKYLFLIDRGSVNVYNSDYSFLSGLKGHNNPVKSVLVLPGNERVLTVSEDNTTRTWELKTGRYLSTCLIMDRNYSFNMVPQGYYIANQEAAKLLYYVTEDLNVISFEQLDVRFNRPDLVLKYTGCKDSLLIKSYYRAWQKRIRKLGIDTIQFRDGYSVPEAELVNREQISTEQSASTLTLHFKGTDSTYALHRFNIWVNETPLFGQRGVDLRKRNTRVLDTTIVINLTQGDNRIEASITNMNGTESYRKPLQVKYIPAVKQKETIHFVGIGIDKFKDSKYNLQYSSKDIRDLARKLKEKYGDDVVIDTLFNEDVTIAKVKSLKTRLKNTTVNDKVVLAYSGHGLLNKEYDYYLSTYAVNFDKPEQEGLAYDELESLLDSIPARKKLMLIDACHSGEVDKDDLEQLNKTPDSLVKGLKPVAYKKEGQLGLKNSFELMQSIFVNVGKSTGATVISAAAGTQFALERNDLQNGVFTFAILEALGNNQKLRISSLKKIVGERVGQLTNGMQKPTSRNETIAVDWEL